MRFGLRAKSALALLACISVVLLVAFFAGWQALRVMEESLGTAFARNLTQYNKQRILAPVARELALSQRLADSELTRRFLLDENNSAHRELFWKEAERYRHAFDDHSYFVISGITRNYYFNDRKTPFSDRPRYALKANDPHDAWFFSTMKNTRDFNINVDPDTKLKLTKVWFNVLVKSEGRNIGLAGTGLDLTAFLNRFLAGSEPGVTPMIVNRQGAIQAHPNRKLIDYASINDKGAAHSTIYRLLSTPADKEAVRNALARAEKNAEKIEIFRADLDGARRLCAVAFIPELGWHVVTTVDLSAARVMDDRLWLPFLAGGSALLLLLLGAIIVAVNRIILAPLLDLTGSVRAMAKGDYETPLPRAGDDELGELTRAFGAMATQVRTHTDELEGKVSERTRALAEANAHMADANKQIGDSIQYASLIQSAILPDAAMARVFGENHFIWWQPRDVVGGDFYVFRADDAGCLLGVVDCAGHGVPGAFMTMIAHAALEAALDVVGLRDPAALLHAMDARIRATLQARPEYSRLATHMDAGLVWMDFERNDVTFAGAKLSLYWCDGTRVGEMKGSRRPVGGKHAADFRNESTFAVENSGVPRTFYLATDGLLDQAGGDKGYSFGDKRFADLIMGCAHLPLDEQKEVFVRAVRNYQGRQSQRDDITLLGFRGEKFGDTAVGLK